MGILPDKLPTAREISTDTNDPRVGTLLERLVSMISISSGLSNLDEQATIELIARWNKIQPTYQNCYKILDTLKNEVATQLSKTTTYEGDLAFFADLFSKLRRGLIKTEGAEKEEHDKKRSRRIFIVGMISFGVGVAVVVTATILYLKNRDKKFATKEDISTLKKDISTLSDSLPAMFNAQTGIVSTMLTEVKSEQKDSSKKIDAASRQIEEIYNSGIARDKRLDESEKTLSKLSDGQSELRREQTEGYTRIGTLLAEKKN